MGLRTMSWCSAASIRAWCPSSRLVSASVKRTEYLIREFDYFKTHQPLRILRQHCRLPLFDRFERTIAVTDFNAAFEPEPDFLVISPKQADYIFPSAKADGFWHGRLQLSGIRSSIERQLRAAPDTVCIAKAIDASLQSLRPQLRLITGNRSQSNGAPGAMPGSRNIGWRLGRGSYVTSSPAHRMI